MQIKRFDNKKAIRKGHIHKTINKGEPVVFDIAEKENGQRTALNITGPEGTNVRGTSVSIYLTIMSFL